MTAQRPRRAGARQRTVYCSAEPHSVLLTRIRNALALLVDLAMRDMAREGREAELRTVLIGLFGEHATAATLKGMREGRDPARTAR